MSLEFALRDWLRTRSNVMDLLDADPRRLDLDWRGEERATHVVLYRDGGGQDLYTPTETGFFTLHCYGTTRKVASDLANAVAYELRRLQAAALNNAVTAYWARVETLAWLPGNAGSQVIPRYVVTTSVMATTVAPAA